MTGENDAVSFGSTAPTLARIAEAPKDATELADGAPNENPFTHAASGSVAFRDADLNDSHTLVFGAQDQGYPGTFQANLTESNGSGSVAWNFVVDDGKLNFLSEGQTLVQTYDLAVSDGHGSTATRAVSVTLTGTNDAVELLSGGNAAASITEIANVTGQTTLHSRSGVIGFRDVDTADTHTVSVGQQTIQALRADGTTITLTDAQQQGLRSALHVSLNEAQDTVSWNYDVQDRNLDFLKAGDRIVVTSQVTIDDGHGGAVSTPITVTLNGANELNLVRNGSFEAYNTSAGGGLVRDFGGWSETWAGSRSITDWSVDRGSVDLIRNYWQAAQGGNSIDLNGGGAGVISQMINTVAGKRYDVVWNVAGNPDDNNTAADRYRLTAGDDTFNGSFNHNGSTRTNMRWSSGDFTFSAEGQTKLAFESLDTGWYGAAIDNVAVYQHTTMDWFT